MSIDIPENANIGHLGWHMDPPTPVWVPGYGVIMRPAPYPVAYAEGMEGLGKLKIKKVLKKAVRAVGKPIKVVAKGVQKAEKTVEKKVVHKIVPKNIRELGVKIAAFTTPVAFVSKNARTEIKKTVGLRTTSGKKAAPAPAIVPASSPSTPGPSPDYVPVTPSAPVSSPVPAPTPSTPESSPDYIPVPSAPVYTPQVTPSKPSTPFGGGGGGSSSSSSSSSSGDEDDEAPSAGSTTPSAPVSTSSDDDALPKVMPSAFDDGKAGSQAGAQSSDSSTSKKGMSTGMKIGIGVGVIALGVGAYLITRKRS